MPGFSFNNAEEAKTGTKASTGIHEFKVKDIVVETIAGKDGKPDWKLGKVTLGCTKTLDGKTTMIDDKTTIIDEKTTIINEKIDIPAQSANIIR